MARAKHIVTAAVVLTIGIGSGVANFVGNEGGDAVQARAVPAALYLLDPALAERPPMPETVPEVVEEVTVLETERGSASFYANSLAGRPTASGVAYNPQEMIAAHRTLPFGSLLRVTNNANGRTVEVRVVDRGPFAKGRVLDLSRRAAEKLDFIRRGHTDVTIEVLE